jgi:hypothetical protein
LETLAPDRLVEASNLPVFETYPAVLQHEIAYRLGNVENGASRAVEILHELAKSGVHTSLILFEATLRELLFRARRWQEFIDAMQAAPMDEQQQAENRLDLALACWAATGHLSEEHCRSVLESLNKSPDPPKYGPQDEAWALWGAGRVADALAVLDEAEPWAEKQGFDDCFSRWRYRRVPLDQYQDDLQKVRRMFKGEPLRPDFLGPTL